MPIMAFASMHMVVLLSFGALLLPVPTVSICCGESRIENCKPCNPISPPPCMYGASCGLGGKCRNGPTCPKGEKPTPGRCGLTKNCVCCAPDKPTGNCSAPFTKVGSEYFYFHDSSKMNWDDALKHCRSIGGSLAEPENMADFITQIEDDYSHMKYDIWLGATDRIESDVWKWVSGGSVPDVLWPAWPGNQPSGDGNCMQIHYHGYSGFFLNDYYCHVKGYFVCECEPKIIHVCKGACKTSRGTGNCKKTCGFGEERIGNCPGGNCACCRRRVTPVCAGMCSIGKERGYCSSSFTGCSQIIGPQPVEPQSELRLSLIPAPSTCDKGCTCCPMWKG